MKVSSGILMYRDTKKEREYLLVRPGGPFYKNKHKGIWTIPKGIVHGNEDEEVAARREFVEETGQEVRGELHHLSRIKLRKSKELTAYYLEGNIDANKIVSNMFELEYPKNSGEYRSFPEIDKGGWYTFDEAIELINPKLVVLLEKLKEIKANVQ